MASLGDKARAVTEMDVDADSLLDTLRAKQRELTIGAIVVVAVAATIWLWRGSVRQKEENAERAFNLAANSYYSGNSQLARTDLEKLVTRYSGTPAGAQGAMLLAQIHYEAGQFDAGIKRLETAASKSGSSTFGSSIEALIAAGYADQKKYDDGAKHYLAAAAKATFANDRDMMRAEAARILMLAGKKDEARKIWLEIAGRIDSPAIGEAKIRLGELSAVPK